MPPGSTLPRPGSRAALLMDDTAMSIQDLTHVGLAVLGPDVLNLQQQVLELSARWSAEVGMPGPLHFRRLMRPDVAPTERRLELVASLVAAIIDAGAWCIASQMSKEDALACAQHYLRDVIVSREDERWYRSTDFWTVLEVLMIGRRVLMVPFDAIVSASDRWRGPGFHHFGVILDPDDLLPAGGVFTATPEQVTLLQAADLSAWLYRRCVHATSAGVTASWFDRALLEVASPLLARVYQSRSNWPPGMDPNGPGVVRRQV